MTAAVHDAKLKPSVVSISWGGPESSWTEQSRDALNSACEDASTMGVTVLAASGDNGSSDGDASGTPTVDFPASSPYVLGCGGTKLKITGTSISSEQAWNELRRAKELTGGGVSEGVRASQLSAKRKCAEGAERLCGPWRARCRGRCRPRKRLQRCGGWRPNRDWRHQRSCSVVGRIAGARQPVAGNQCRLRESAFICGESRRRISRRHFRKQRPVFCWTRLGRLHRLG